VHSDLAAEHILLDPATHQVTGIIDWSEISVGDPAIDFAGMFHWGGLDFLNAVLSHYRHHLDAGLRERARILAVARGIGDIVFGREMHRPEYIDAGVRALRLCLASLVAPVQCPDASTVAGSVRPPATPAGHRGSRRSTR
jgi:hypothetical protein